MSRHTTPARRAQQQSIAILLLGAMSALLSLYAIWLAVFVDTRELAPYAATPALALYLGFAFGKATPDDEPDRAPPLKALPAPTPAPSPWLERARRAADRDDGAAPWTAPDGLVSRALLSETCPQPTHELLTRWRRA